MTKADLVTKIAEESGITKVQAEKALNSFIGGVTDVIKASDKLTLVGFGTFSTSKRAARIGRNPQTGLEIHISAKTNGKFTPGKNLKDIDATPANPTVSVKVATKKK